jgi:hypothetical protein
LFVFAANREARFKRLSERVNGLNAARYSAVKRKGSILAKKDAN